MKNTLKIIIVGYNEEKNLPKLFKSLLLLKKYFDIKLIYVDQSSQDKSLDIAKLNNAEFYIRDNLGFADPDKMWAINKFVRKGEWFLSLDADEELTKFFVEEIYELIKEDKYNVIGCPIKIHFMGIVRSISIQYRLAKKGFLNITNKVHNTRSLNEKSKMYILKNSIINVDLKLKGDEIGLLTTKNNKYSSLEADQKLKVSKGKIFLKMIFMPIIYFLYFGLVHKNFFKGVPGFINALIYAHYQFLLYAKLYEKTFKS